MPSATTGLGKSSHPRHTQLPGKKFNKAKLAGQAVQLARFLKTAKHADCDFGCPKEANLTEEEAGAKMPRSQMR